MPTNLPTSAATGASRVIAGVVGFALAGVGLSVLGYLWLSPFGQWDSPPLFFRIFGSFIAIVFVAIGGTALWGAAAGKINPISAKSMFGSSPAPSPAAADAGTYVCPHCAAPLGSQADVSPSGDVKCQFCKSWFNIHKSANS